MSVLVLHYRGSIAATPYDRWVAGYGGDVLLLTAEEGNLAPATDGYLHAAAVPGYETGGQVEPLCLDLAREHGVRHIVACQERDLERAAQLREILGLPGQRMDSVLPFRDKVLMKERFIAAGLRVAPYRVVECAADLLAFAGEHGFPVVVKPRDSAGSVGLRILRSADELEAYLADEPDLYGEHPPNLIVEGFVPGPMCHVDGLVVGGRVVLAWPSQYLYSLSSFREDRGGRMDVTLDVDDPLTGRLIELTERALQALPGPRDFAFHAEIFHTPGDELVLCEIACRTGGASVRDVIRILFGVDPTESWVRAQLGLPLPAVLTEAGPERPLPGRMTGQLVLMKRPGRVVSVPEGPPPFPWIEKYQVFVQPGQTMRAATFSADFLLTTLVSGPDRATCVARLRQVEAWFMDGLVLDDPALPRPHHANA
ncbi:hypothetical protein [Spongiactinospora sp. TRM90649]|uniref:ATP-grasp domain-containing protein n=1 Tax=Spongiactinospora sp. TRM90649 TaxID=3031114 RepID=UPI0023F9B108|nr:hypothetical protein [Spongiactinospora sp. TRM90649]MDF5753553.1 hypothetical protein [Spongiactinospora sp. TRM90649]